MGVRVKLLILLACLGFFFLAASATSLVGLYRIDQTSSIIIERETPFVRSIEEALFAMIEGQFAAERALDLDSPAQIAEVQVLKDAFEQSNKRFRMLLAAITWGSETEAFKRSDNGNNYRAWIDAGYAGTFIVLESPTGQADPAGQASVYYNGYTNNVTKAVAERERYIELLETEPEAAEAAREAAKDYQSKARRFADLTAENLREMISISNQTTAENAERLQKTQRDVQIFTVLISVIGLLVSMGIGFFFAERIIVEPIRRLAETAQAFGAATFTTRASVSSNDELGLLGQSFNAMADKLAEYTKGLEGEVAKRTAELSKANDTLRELDKVKSEFISVAAHQLRTPLSALKWVMGILIDDNSTNLTAEQRSLLLKGFESNERMINLVNEMLIVTRIESGKERFTFAPLHIEDAIENTILDFAGQAHVRKIQLTFQKPPERLPFISADPEKIRAVLQNLIENAMRYSLDGGSITLSASRREKFIHVSVADTGIGIPEKQQASIFNKFFRADNAVKQQTDGSGLGLFIAKSIIEKHGGTMDFESAEGKGTTFTFTIPMSTDATGAPLS
jgi:signal transduction histidine kinase